MIARDQNIALLTVRTSALKNPEWIDYADYCFDRERGLRKQAFKHLDRFLKSTENWTIERKIEFLKFLFPFFEKFKDADYGPFPQPLRDILIKPTLINWCETEKSDENPFRWYGKYFHSEEHLFKALKINPSDDLARQELLGKWTYEIYYSVHHLPEGYIGEPIEDIKLGEKIKEHISKLTTQELRQNWTKEAEEDLELVRNYIAWEISGQSDFEKWGEENKKRTRYGIQRTYYYEK